ncbi:lysis system i-spanin subunit Rz [Neisseria leonii]|uniref:Lysis protein n=1 Tax=Neisseria leonii TaxID=2995413 RepID=A0A9X4IE16_9NEIS|nr:MULTISPECIES: lysis system i-spanin subunit Rz [unclassified Neisseria]MDD9324734.1 lysis protein [Neisseria sp. 3986]MDD9327703.1 lysis protein [Neisseria sp. 51.81]
MMLKAVSAAALLSAAAAGLLSWYLTDTAWQAKWDEAEQGRLKKEIQTVTQTVYIEREAAAKTAQADAKGQKELAHAQAEIKRLRADLAAGTRRLRRQTACSTATEHQSGTDSRVDSERPAEPAAGGGGVEQHILNVADHALTAIAQRDACVDILKSDRAVLSGDPHEQTSDR